MQPFRTVNRRTSPDFRDGWQRHHLIPRQLGSDPAAADVFASIRRFGFSLDDFRGNGVLLPATHAAAVSSGLPMHAGPHPGYNFRLATLVGAIGAASTHPVLRFARMRLLQSQVRCLLTTPRHPPLSLDRVDVSIDCSAHRALDAEVRALLAGFAQGGDCA